MKNLLKKLTTVILSIGVSVATLGCGTFGFSSDTHQYTTTRGIEICKQVMKDTKKMYTKEVYDQLYKFCTKPDDDEIEGAYKVHFYNPATEKNFNGEDDSALYRFKMHYDNALKLFKEGKELDSISELGRALHFLEDMNTPVHTNNQSFLDSTIDVFLHTSFEKRCVEVQSEVVSKMLGREFDYYVNNTIEQIGKSSAFLANDNFYSLYKKKLPRDIIAKNSIENAQKAVAGVLYRFFLDVQKIK